MICDCCGRKRADLPFHHDAHDDSGQSWDYCQTCYDVGCDLRDCSLGLECFERHPTVAHYFCTLPLGHPGQHEALIGAAFVNWDDPAPTEAEVQAAIQSILGR